MKQTCNRDSVVLDAIVKMNHINIAIENILFHILSAMFQND